MERVESTKQVETTLILSIIIERGGMVNYPEIITDNVRPPNYSAKMPLDELLKVWREQSSSGLYVVPKVTGDKRAHWRFWAKKNGNIPLIPTEDNLKEWLPRTDIDGFITVVGRSNNGRLVVLDIDTGDSLDKAKETFNKIQQLSPSEYVHGTPSNGAHIYYLLPEGAEQLRPGAHVHFENLDIRCKNSLIGSVGSYQQYTGQKAQGKGVADGHVGYYRRVADGQYDTIPEMSHELYQLLWEAQNKGKATGDVRTAAEYEKSPQAVARIERHFRQSASDQEKVVRECLDVILTKREERWTRQDWLEVMFAAWHGCNGSSNIRDYVLMHPSAPWDLTDSRRDDFREGWDEHEHQDSGVTVATLFWLARQNGWLSITDYEIPDRVATHINVRYVQTWIESLPSIPERCLLLSQTGSGKTYALKYLYEQLGKPKTVVFVPSIKLAMELAGTLYHEYGLPTTLYIDPHSGKTKTTDQLLKADILITTLQTFATKVFRNGIDMSIYGLVYIEESDQLLQQFARGSAEKQAIASHVSGIEARDGYACIRSVFEKSGVVWCVDATMTQVTYRVAEALRGDRTIRVIKNDWQQQKAPVHMLSTKGEAYQVVMRSLEQNKRVVVACDTAQIAEEVTRTMEMMGLFEKKKYLCITKTSERDKEVHRFMDNVNKIAPEYDFVAYNSVMASGVSITSVKPDVVVQICTYLTPRANIQMLNRYRQQEVVYCYYRDTESFYVKNVNEVMSEAEKRAWIEAGVINLTLAERTDDAKLRDVITAISVADEMEQNRSGRDFYISLLKRDGRTVHNEFNVQLSSMLNGTIMQLRKMRKEDREYVRQHWIEVPPLEIDATIPDEYTELEINMGTAHRIIRDAFDGNMPDESPETLYDIVKSFRNRTWVIDSFLDQQKTLEASEMKVMNRNISIMMLANRITLMKVLSTIHMLYYTLDEVLTPAKVKERAPIFIAMLTNMSNDYDAAIQRQRQKFSEVYDRNDNDEARALDYAKILLSYVGLKQRSEQVRIGDVRESVNRIVNLDDFNKFLEWRGKGSINELTTAQIDARITSRKESIELFEGLTEKQRNRVIELMNENNKIDFATAVAIALDDEGEPF